VVTKDVPEGAVMVGIPARSTLVDAAEAMLLAESGDARSDAASAFGAVLFGLSGGTDAAGVRWGLLWGAALQESEAGARGLFAAARAAPPPPRATFHGMRALRMLDRWAGTIAARGGERRWRREGLLLLRIGLFGR
jgi:phytoene synthase